jgi:hypothetical protein
MWRCGGGPAKTRSQTPAVPSARPRALSARGRNLAGCGGIIPPRFESDLVFNRKSAHSPFHSRLFCFGRWKPRGSRL